HNLVSGSIELAQAAKSYGVRAIHGAEIDLTTARDCGVLSPRHITLLVRDRRGWSNLCRIITLAHERTREGANRREVTSPCVDLQAVLDRAEGLICLTGCADRSVVGNGVSDEPTARRLLDAFGPEDLYVELQRPYGRHDRARNNALAALARRLG